MYVYWFYNLADSFADKLSGEFVFALCLQDQQQSIIINQQQSIMFSYAWHGHTLAMAMSIGLGGHWAMDPKAYNVWKAWP